MKEHTQLLLEKAERAIRAAKVLLGAGESEFAAAFGREFAKPGALDPKFHRWLLTAFDIRLEGDYQVISHVASEDLETGLEQAQEFLTAARSFLLGNHAQVVLTTESSAGP